MTLCMMLMILKRMHGTSVDFTLFFLLGMSFEQQAGKCCTLRTYEFGKS